MEDLKKKLQEEIAVLENELRVTLPKEILTARAHGDLSENAEYHAARERQALHLLTTLVAYVNLRIARRRRGKGELRAVGRPCGRAAGSEPGGGVGAGAVSGRFNTGGTGIAAAAGIFLRLGVVAGSGSPPHQGVWPYQHAA